MNYLKFSKKQLICCFLALSNLLVFNSLQAQGTSVKTNPGKAKPNGCEYQTISGLAEVISVEKVLPKDSSVLEYDEYSIKFKFIPKEGGQLIASYRDQEMEFLLSSKGEKFRVGPQYIRQYQIRKNTKYSMKILQGPLCEEKIKFGETGGLPNDAFEAGDKVENIKKRRLEEGLLTAENDFAAKHPDAVPDEAKDPEEKTAEQLAAEAAEAERLKLEEAARIERETAFQREEERRARMAEGNPDEEANPNNPDENTDVPNPDGSNPSNPDDENPSNPDNANPSDPDEEPKHRSTATVTEASVTDSSNVDNSNPSDNSDVNPNFANNTNAIDTQKIAEEARLLAEREFAAQQAKEEAARKKQEEKEAAARKKQEEKEAKEKAKQEEKLRKEQEKIKKEEEARLARQREIEEQQRKAQEERLKKDLADKMRQDMLKEAEAKAKADAEAKAKAEEDAKAAAKAKADEEAREAAEKKAQEDELKRSECTYQTKIAGVIQVINVKKVTEAEQSRLGYAEYEVKVKFTPSNVADLPRNSQKLFDAEYTFVIDAQGKSANPSAAYIKKYSVLNNARFNGFAQIINGGICNSMIFFSPQLPIDAAQLNLK